MSEQQGAIEGLPDATCSQVWDQVRRLSIQHVGVEITASSAPANLDEIREEIRRFHNAQVNELDRVLHNFERDAKAILSENVTGQPALPRAAESNRVKP